MPAPVAVPQSTPTVLQQRIASGQLFNGSMPAAAPTVDKSNGLFKYAAPADSVMGLFLWKTREPIVVTQFLIDLGANGDVTVKVVNLDPDTVDTTQAILSGEVVTYQTATTVPRLMLNETNFRITLLPFQAIQLITTNSGAAQIAQCTAYLARPRLGG